jgi:hypothetical protein
MSTSARLLELAHLMHTVVLPTLEDDVLSVDDHINLAEALRPFVMPTIRHLLVSTKMSVYRLCVRANGLKAVGVVRALETHTELWQTKDWCMRWEKACMTDDVQTASDIRARIGDAALPAHCCEHRKLQPLKVRFQ